MADRWIVVMVAAAALGALQPSSVPLVTAAFVVTLALWGRSPVLLCVAVALCASALAQRAHDGLRGVEEGLVTGSVTLVSDPEPGPGGQRAEVRIDGARVELRAAGPAADALAPRLAGEVVHVRGRLTPAPADNAWRLSRHLAGQLTVLRVDSWRAGDPASRAANGLRRVLADGADPLSRTHRSLYTGLVIGDDRAQPAELADDFLGAGMTHLLAVSGQNVAFCLVLAGPLLRRLRLWPRLAATLAVIAMFGLMTRFEPSVLRASAMAALAATVITIGRPASRVRIIGLAATGLLLVDPLLVHSVGFRLSMAACAAIVLLAPPISSVLPGPAAIRDALGVTLAAQLGVAPVLLATFGPMPVASIPANLLAVPVAGAVMAWGITAGLVAGVAGGAFAELVHLPTRLALDWLELVADRAAGAPLGELHLVHVALVAGGFGLAALRRRVPAIWPVGLSAAAVALAAATVSAHAPPGLRSNPQVGLVRWHADGTDVIVLGGVGGRASLGARTVLEHLRTEGVGSIELLVIADGEVPESTVAAVVAAHVTAAVVAYGDGLAGSGIDAARAPPVDTIADVGALQVRFVPATDRVVVEARPSAG